MNTEITGAPTEAKRRKQLAKPHGGKAGRAMANQSAKYTPEKPALVGRKVLRANSASAQVQGKQPGPLNPAHGMAATKPQGHLARGITSRDAPQSSAAIQANKAAAKPAPKKGKVATAKPAKVAKGARSDAKITIVIKDIKTSGIREDSDRYAKLAWMLKHKPATVGHAVGKDYGRGKRLASGCLAGMVKRGHIKIG